MCRSHWRRGLARDIFGDVYLHEPELALPIPDGRPVPLLQLLQPLLQLPGPQLRLLLLLATAPQILLQGKQLHAEQTASQSVSEGEDKGTGCSTNRESTRSGYTAQDTSALSHTNRFENKSVKAQLLSESSAQVHNSLFFFFTYLVIICFLMFLSFIQVWTVVLSNPPNPSFCFSFAVDYDSGTHKPLS